MLEKGDEQISPRKTLKVSNYDKNKWEQRKLEKVCREIEKERKKTSRRIESERVFWKSKSRELSETVAESGSPYETDSHKYSPKSFEGIFPWSDLPAGFRFHANGEPKVSRHPTLCKHASFSAKPAASSQSLPQQSHQTKNSSSRANTPIAVPSSWRSSQELQPGRQTPFGTSNNDGVPKQEVSLGLQKNNRSRRKTSCEACMRSADKMLPVVTRGFAKSPASSQTLALGSSFGRLSLSSVAPNKSATPASTPGRSNTSTDMVTAKGPQNDSLLESLKYVEKQRRQKVKAHIIINQKERDYKEVMRRVSLFSKSLPQPNVSIKRWRTSKGENMKMPRGLEKAALSIPELTDPRSAMQIGQTDPHKAIAICNLTSLKQAWL